MCIKKTRNYLLEFIIIIIIIVVIFLMNLLQRRGTSNDINQFVGNNGLSGTVVKNGVLADHIGGVLGSIVHSVSSGRNLSGVALSQTPENVVGKRELSEVTDDLIFNLERRKLGRRLKSLSGEDRKESGLERNTGKELVVKDFNGVILSTERDDLVGNGSSFNEGRSLLTDRSKRSNNVIGVRTRNLGLDLVTNGNDFSVGVLGKTVTSSTSKLRVDGTAKTLIGGHGNDELLGSFGGNSSLGIVVDLLVGRAIDTGDSHTTLGLVESGRSNNLHGVGDLLNVLDRLETSLNFTKSSIGSKRRVC